MLGWEIIDVIKVNALLISTKFIAMTLYTKQALLDECLTILNYYLNKTEVLMKLYQASTESQYFLFAIKSTMAFLQSTTNPDMAYLKKCIDGLIAGQRDQSKEDHLGNLKDEMVEELRLLKLRYDLE